MKGVHCYLADVMRKRVSVCDLLGVMMAWGAVGDGGEGCGEVGEVFVGDGGSEGRGGGEALGCLDTLVGGGRASVVSDNGRGLDLGLGLAR